MVAYENTWMCSPWMLIPNAVHRPSCESDSGPPWGWFRDRGNLLELRRADLVKVIESINKKWCEIEAIRCESERNEQLSSFECEGYD